MRIEYRANGMQREVRDSVGEALVSRNIATRVYQTRQLSAKSEPETVEAEEPVEISPRTGKPKRKYKRRDMKAEE
jgi:hypothetical protein